MSFLDLYFEETNEEFGNSNSRNKNVVLLVEYSSYIKLEFSNCGEHINILEHSAEDFMCHLNDEYLVNELYSVIKMNFIKENWLFILIQIIFDLAFINQYPNLKKFIKDNIYQEYTERSYIRNNVKSYE